MGRFTYRKLNIRLTHSKYYLYAVSFVLSLVAPLVTVVPTASASATVNTYPLASGYTNPGQMTVADDSLWYLEGTSSKPNGYIGQRTTSGTTTDYDITSLGGVSSLQLGHLTTGPDGNVWFDGCASTVGYAGFLNVSTGAVTLYQNTLLPVGSSCLNGAGPIATASDGYVWYVMQGYTSNNTHTYVFAVNPATGVTDTGTYTSDYWNISSMANGPDGRLWLTDTSNNYNYVYAMTVSAGHWAGQSSYRITTSQYTIPNSIVAGPDGKMWFAETGVGRIANYTTSGVLTEYSLPSGTAHPLTLTFGPDGALWFTGNAQVGRMTTTGSTTTYTIPGTGLYANPGIALGPDDAIWFDYISYTTGGTIYGLGNFTWN